MRDNFGIGGRLEHVAFGGELAPELKVIFDDAVVDHGDFIFAVGVRVAVLVGRPSVRRPSGVGYADMAV